MRAYSTPATAQQWSGAPLRSRQPKPLGNPAAIRDRPELLDAEAILELQRSAGNQAVAKLVTEMDHEAGTHDLTVIRQGEAPAAASYLLPSLQRAGPAAAPAPVAAGPEQADIKRYEKAKARHDRNRQTLKNYVDRGFNQKHDRMLKNSAEWVREGHIKLFPLTPTHDSHARAAAAGNPSGAAYFSYPGGDLMSGAVYYTRKSAADANYDNTNVNLQDSTSVDGFQNPGEIAIMQSAIDKGHEYVWAVLRHEIQHAADFHGGTAIEGYKTEFRAYWLGSREYNVYSPTTKVNRKGWNWNARQYAIFNNLYTSSDYAYVKTAWDAENGTPKASRVFQNAVVKFTRPESINPANSIRVDAFYKQLTSTSQADCDANSPVRPNLNVALLRVTADELDAADRRDMRANPEITTALNAHLKGDVLDEIKEILAKK